MAYDVLLTKKDDKFVARVCQWPAIAAESDTEEEALHQVQANIQSLLAAGRIVQLEVDIQPEGHPWQQFAGMFASDPDWVAFQASIREYREEIDRDSGFDEQAQTIFRRLRVQNMRIGTQDIRIAATTLSHGATLVTRNVRDFATIPSLNIEDWSLPGEDVTTDE